MTADPGGVFASDEHRRVLGHCGVPRTLDQLAAVVYADQSTQLHPEDGHAGVRAVVEDLVAEGFMGEGDGSYFIQDKGYEALGGPNANEPADKSHDEAKAQMEAFVKSERTKVDAEIKRIERAVNDGDVAPNALARAKENVATYKAELDELAATAVPPQEA